MPLPTAPPTPLVPSGSTRRPAGRRLMTLCLPSNRLFDKALAHLMRTMLPGAATGSEECEPHTHTHTHHTCACTHVHTMRVWENGQGWLGHWEPLIFIHDREKVLVCWHRLLHLHSVIDCLPQRGSFVYLQIDEPVLLTLSLCHPLMLPSQENSSKLDGEQCAAWKRILAPLCDRFPAVNIRNKLGNVHMCRQREEYWSAFRCKPILCHSRNWKRKLKKYRQLIFKTSTSRAAMSKAYKTW